MMGAPGSKQKHVSHEDMGYDNKPAPQHLCSQRPRPVAGERERPATSSGLPNPGSAAAATGGGSRLSPGGRGVGAHAQQASARKPDDAGASGGGSGAPRRTGPAGPRTSGSGEGGCAGSHSNGHEVNLGARPLPILAAMPSGASDPPTGVVTAVVAGVVGGGIMAGRSVTGVLLRS